MMERFSPDTVERLSGALGAAVLKVWGQLPHDFQHKIFEEAVISSGEAIRNNLAQLLLDRKSPARRRRRALLIRLHHVSR